MLKRVRFGSACWVSGVRYTIGEVAELPDSVARDLITMRRAELAPKPPATPEPAESPAPRAPRPAAPRKQPTPPKEA